MDKMWSFAAKTGSFVAKTGSFVAKTNLAAWIGSGIAKLLI